MKWLAVRHWSIRARVLFLALAPVLLSLVLLSYYVISARIQDVNAGFNERGRALAKHLAAASEFGLFSGNREQLQSLAQAALQENDVDRIEILDLDRKKIVVATRDGRFADETVYPRDSDLLQSFQEQVTASGVAAFDFAERPPGGVPERSGALGMVRVEMSRQSTLQRQREIIANSVLIGAGGLLISILFALVVGRSVVDPVLRLNTTLRSLTRGVLSVRVPANSGGELGVLENGFNAMAESIESAQLTLHNKVHEATAELQHTVAMLEQRNRELDLARDQAMQAGQAKSDFLARMSHEIRTPINAMIGFAKLLTAVPDAPRQREYAQTINQAAAQLLNAVDDILNFSRIESGALRLECIPFDLRDSLEEAVCMLRPGAHDKRLELVLMIDADVPVKFLGDPARLGQVLMNLVNNAIKFTDSGSVTVRAQLANQETGAALVRISVADTGIGISAEEQQRLFSAFAQADTSISRRYGGTGLGLVIAKRLVEMMHGEISLESAVGQGSTFMFTARWQLQAEAAPAKNSQAFAARKVLLVEQHALARRALRNLFFDWGMPVFTTPEVAKMHSMLHAAVRERAPYDVVVVSVPAAAQRQELHAQLAALREVYAGAVLLLLNSEDCDLPAPFAGDAQISCLAKPARVKTLHDTLARMLGAPAAEDAASLFPAAAAVSQFAGLHVLLAEDNEFNRTLLTTWLRAQGVQVDEAHDGVAAVERAQAQTYDLILMDIHMPLLDGAEAARRIRASADGSARVPIIALTADVFADDRAQLIGAGLDDCVFKPVHEETLWSVIARWTGRAPQDGVTAAVAVPGPESHIRMAALPEALSKKLPAELRMHLEQLHSALAARDAPALYEHAHKLNGVAGYFGVQALAHAAHELERIALAAQFDAAQPVLNTIEREVTRALVT